jgi:hypothetical protein
MDMPEVITIMRALAEGTNPETGEAGKNQAAIHSQATKNTNLDRAPIRRNYRNGGSYGRTRWLIQELGG